MAGNFRTFGNIPEPRKESEYYTVTTPDVELQVNLGGAPERRSVPRQSLPQRPSQARPSLTPRISEPLQDRTSQQLNRPSLAARASSPHTKAAQVRQLFGESVLPPAEGRNSAILQLFAESAAAEASLSVLGQHLAQEQLHVSGLQEENRGLKAHYEEYIDRLQLENTQLRGVEEQLHRASQAKQYLQQQMESLAETSARRSSHEVATTAQHYREKMVRLKAEVKTLESRANLQRQRIQFLGEQLRENKVISAAELQTLNGALTALRERYNEVRQENITLRSAAARMEKDGKVAALLEAKECNIEALQQRLRVLETERSLPLDCTRCLHKDLVIDEMSTLLTKEPAPLAVSRDCVTVAEQSGEAYVPYQPAVERVVMPAAEVTPRVLISPRTVVSGGPIRSGLPVTRERYADSAYLPAQSYTERSYEVPNSTRTYEPSPVTRTYEPSPVTRTYDTPVVRRTFDTSSTTRTYDTPVVTRTYDAPMIRQSFETRADSPRRYVTERVYEPEPVLPSPGAQRIYASPAYTSSCTQCSHCSHGRAPTTISVLRRENDAFGNVHSEESVVFVD